MRFALIIFTVFVISGCSAKDVKQYADTEPRLDLFVYFQGTTKGWGMVQNRSGELTRQFIVAIEGRLDQHGNLIMAEDFTWSDGEKSSRTWTISGNNDRTYSGTAEDVAGRATGTAAGSVFNWQYHLNLKVDDSSWKIFFDDWMYLQPDTVLINRTRMSKLGFHVGDVTIVFQKQAS